MSCPACGGRTTRRGRCRECEQIERLEEEFSSAASRSDRYECPECGLAESDAPDRQCWVCRSDRHTRDADGHVVEAGDAGEESTTTNSDATTDTMFQNTTETETNSDDNDQIRTDGGTDAGESETDEWDVIRVRPTDAVPTVDKVNVEFRANSGGPVDDDHCKRISESEAWRLGHKLLDAGVGAKKCDRCDRKFKPAEADVPWIAECPVCRVALDPLEINLEGPGVASVVPPSDLCGERLADEFETVSTTLVSEQPIATAARDWWEWMSCRVMVLWDECRSRSVVDQPECPECGHDNWVRSQGEPWRCSGCDFYAPEQSERIRESRERIVDDVRAGDGEGIETDGGDDIEECCLVEADRLYPPCMSESPEGLSCNRPEGHEGPHWCCSVPDGEHPKTEWDADETGRGQIEADGGSQEQKPSPIWTHWISPDEPVRLVTIARVVQVGDGAAAERSGRDVVLWPGRHPETRIWETADERDDPQPTVIRATCHVSLGTVMPASGAVDHYRALARSSASEVGWPAGAGFDQEESGESEVATDGGQVEVGGEGVVTATAPDDTDCVTYGPVSVADGDWIDTWMLTVTTESGCVEVELPRGAMYSLWREVRGVPWPEAQTENRERHRFVQELVRRGNDASLQLLSDAVQVLRGDLVAVDPQEVRR